MFTLVGAYSMVFHIWRYVQRITSIFHTIIGISMAVRIYYEMIFVLAGSSHESQVADIPGFFIGMSRANISLTKFDYNRDSYI